MISNLQAAVLKINSKTKMPRIWPWVLGCGICLIILLSAVKSPVWILWFLVPLIGAALAWAVHADAMRKTVVLFYELEPHIEDAYKHLHQAVDLWQGCSEVLQVESMGSLTNSYDRKMHAGASALTKQKRISPSSASPPYFKANISIPVLPGAERTLYLLPDRILVWEKYGVGAVGFEDLDMTYHDQRVAVPYGVPGDAQIVDKTWRYVNKKGGPDKRFKNNREIPIVVFEEVSLTSKNGLNEIFHLSRTGITAQLRAAVKQMALSIHQRAETPKGFIKCPCKNCDVLIEFPSEGLGQKVVCPRCGMETILFKPAARVGR